MQISEELLWEYSWALRPQSLKGQFLLLHMAIADKARTQRDLAGADRLNVGYGTLSRWLNGTAPLGVEPLKRMAKVFYKNDVGVTQENLISSDFIASYYFLEEASTLGEIHKTNIPKLASKFLTILEIPIDIGHSLPARSDLVKPHGKSSANELQSLGQKSGQSLKEVSKPGRVTQKQKSQSTKTDFVPQSPGFAPRPKKFNEIKSIILSTENSPRNVALTTILHGFGGFGKTTLAKEIYNDPEVRCAFPDGVFWVQCQQSLSLKPEAIVESLLRRFASDWDKGAISDPISAKREFVRAIGEKQMLIVIDDVWYNAHAELFRDLPPTCVVLMTTRMKHLAPHGMSEILVDAMEPDEALSILSNLQSNGARVNLSKSEVDHLERLAQRLGYWAQLLALANGRIRRSIDKGQALEQAVSNYESLIEKRGIVVADIRDLSGSANEARSNAMRLCMDASLQMLTEDELEHFQALGVLPKDADIPVQVISEYWHEGNGTSVDESLELLETFADMSLLTLTLGERELVALHDNIVDYLNRRMDEQTRMAAHQSMVAAVAANCCGVWEDLPHDHRYGWLYLLNHMEAAGKKELADGCRVNFLWLKAKLDAVGAQNLHRSFFSELQTLDAALVGRAIVLSLPVILEHPSQFAHQLYGRLAHESSKIIKTLVHTASLGREFSPTPIQPHLPPIGNEQIRLTGHSGSVNSAEFSKDGDKILTSSSDTTVRLWDLMSGVELRRIEGHEGPVSSAAFSSDEQFVLTSSKDRTARLWNLDACVEIQRYDEHKRGVFSASFSPDESKILTVSADGSARIWDTKSGTLIQQIIGRTLWLNGAVFAHNGHQILTASRNKTASLWDVKSGKQIQNFEGHQAGVSSAVFSSCGNHVLTASNDKTARLWNAHSGKEIQRYGEHPSEVMSAIFAHDQKQVLTTTRSGEVLLWDVETGEQVQNFGGHTSNVVEALFSPQDEFVITASRDCTAKLWSVSSGIEVTRFEGHTRSILDANFSARGNAVITASEDCTSRVWKSTGSSGIRAHRRKHSGQINGVVYSPQGNHAVSVSANGHTAMVWDPSNGSVTQEFLGHLGVVKTAIFSSDGSKVLTASCDKTARLWDVASAQELMCFQGHKSTVRTAVFSPKADKILTASEDSTARFWDIKSGQEIARLEGHTLELTKADFSADGSTVFTTCIGDDFRMWDTNTTEPIFTNFGDAFVSRSVAVFSPCENHVVSDSGGSIPRLLDSRTGNLILEFKSSRRCHSAVFSPDGDMLLLVGHNRIDLWRIKTGTKVHSFRFSSRAMNAAFSTSCDQVLTVSLSGLFQVFDIVSGKELNRVVFDTPLNTVSQSADTCAIGDSIGNVHYFRFDFL